jgi:hypothetical protein
MTSGKTDYLAVVYEKNVLCQMPPSHQVTAKKLESTFANVSHRIMSCVTINDNPCLTEPRRMEIADASGGN